MEREKMIEEIAKIIDEMYNVYTTTAEDIAEGIYNAGYRKIGELEFDNENIKFNMKETEKASFNINQMNGNLILENEALKDRLAELEKKIENGTLKEVVRCKDCVYFQPEFVEMENKERRPYTKEEIKNGKFVTIEKGINCGSRCERFRYWNENRYPVWFNENDFCSYGKPKPKHG